MRRYNRPLFISASLLTFAAVILLLSGCGGPFYISQEDLDNFLELIEPVPRFVAVGVNGLAYWSRDGTQWTDCSPGGADFNGITYGNGRFVAVGVGPRIMWSADGKGNWNDAGPGGGLDLIGVTYGNGRFVAVGGTGQVWWSTSGDSGSWVSAIASATNLYAVSYGGGRFVAVDNGGQAYWSTDATSGSWSVANPTGLSSITWAITHGAGRFVTVGQVAVNDACSDCHAPTGFNVGWSTDGVGWSTATVGGNMLVGVTYGNSRFMAVGQSGATWWSPDGAAGNWFDSSPGGNDLQAVAYGEANGEGRFVAVGDSGLVQWSADGDTWNTDVAGSDWLNGVAFGLLENEDFNLGEIDE